MSSPPPRRRVLFVAEAVTLAQVVRLVELARALDSTRYEVHFASAQFSDLVFADTSFRRHPIHSLSAEQVERAVRGGGRIYGTHTLRRYVADDLRVIDEVKPDLVVGDLRWSLLVSAPLRDVPLAALINAYWSPHRERTEFPLPAHPIVKLLGVDLARRYFPRALPWVFRHFAAPLNALRREHGLPNVGDLQHLLTAGDLTLYPDIPELIPLRDAPASHHFLGPVQWAPSVPLPRWWDDLGARPLCYLTLGSSGDLRALSRVLEGVAGLPMDVMFATAGRIAPSDLPRNVFAADFLPGDLAARRAAVVISNGGSTTGYQALGEGTPVVGVPSNLDQYLAMAAIKDAGAGEWVRSDALTAEAVRAAVTRVLEGDARAAARRIAEAMRRYDARERFAELVKEVVHRGA